MDKLVVNLLTDKLTVNNSSIITNELNLLINWLSIYLIVK